MEEPRKPEEGTTFSEFDLALEESRWQNEKVVEETFERGLAELEDFLAGE